MADEQGTTESQAGADQQPEQAQFAIDHIYLKDISLETPMGIDAFSKEHKQKVDLDLNTNSKPVRDNWYEVVLRITITVKDGDSDDTLYLIEVHQAGLFYAVGLAEDDLKRVIATAAPTTLFPYARETIDSLVVKANFPPLRLAPINFDGLVAAAIQRQKQAEEQAGDAASETVQ